MKKLVAVAVVVVALGLITEAPGVPAASSKAKPQPKRTRFFLNTDQDRLGHLDLNHHFPNGPKNWFLFSVKVETVCEGMDPGVERMVFSEPFDPSDHTWTLTNGIDRAVLRFGPKSRNTYNANRLTGTVRFDNGFCDSGHVHIEASKIKGPSTP